MNRATAIFPLAILVTFSFASKGMGQTRSYKVASIPSPNATNNDHYGNWYYDQSGPVPRERIEEHRASAQSNPQTAESESSPVPARGNQTPAANINRQHKQDRAEAVRVAGSVNISRDWYDRLVILFTALLIIVTALQWRLLSWTYVADHRPKIAIRYVSLIRPEGEDEEWFRPGENGESELVPMGVVLVLVNEGNAKARIIEGNITLSTHSAGHRVEAVIRNKPELPPFDKITGTPSYSDDRKALVGTAIAGGRRLVTHKSLPKAQSTNEAVDTYLAIQRDRSMNYVAFYVLGYLKYRDWTRRHYTTAFCRRYDPQRDRFVTIDNPDYEYAE